MRIVSTSKVTAAAAMMLLNTACIEQTPTRKTLPERAATNAYIQRDAAGNLVQGTARSTATPPKVTQNTVTLHSLQSHSGLQPIRSRGGRIYDDFITELDAQSLITQRNPLLRLANESSTAISDTDSYRCSLCHGFDYEGGIFTWNGGTTNNLLELRGVRRRTDQDVVNLLFNGFRILDGSNTISVHNYSALITPQAMVDVSKFVVSEIFDTHQFISAATHESLGDMGAGMELYNSPPPAAAGMGGIPTVMRIDGSNFNCVVCHGSDGKGLGASNQKTTTIDLPTLAWNLPFRFLHRTLFGSPRSQILYPGFTTDSNVMPGFYETVITVDVRVGGAEEGAATMKHVQMMKTTAP